METDGLIEREGGEIVDLNDDAGSLLIEQVGDLLIRHGMLDQPSAGDIQEKTFVCLGAWAGWPQYWTTVTAIDDVPKEELIEDLAADTKKRELRYKMAVVIGRPFAAYRNNPREAMLADLGLEITLPLDVFERISATSIETLLEQRMTTVSIVRELEGDNLVTSGTGLSPACRKGGAGGEDQEAAPGGKVVPLRRPGR